ncbi:MAG: hypothetical protein IMZ66_03940, partial [Planctomycetes bacterium]|nr:hypothetical protein [Planctomycetota bacterium]
AKTPAEKPAQPPAPTAKTPDETPAQPAAPAEKTPAETPAEPAPPAPDPATTKSAPPVRPAAGGFKVEPFDPAALKAGQYAGRTVCWKAQVLAIKSAQPGIVSVLVYEQGTDRVEADLKFRGNLIAGVGTGRTIVFEGTVERPAAGATAEGPLTLTNVRVDLAALAAEMATPASPPATPAETPATGDAAAPEAP